MKGSLILAMLLILAAPSYAQEATITGLVTDAESGDPLPGVNVILIGTTRGAATNVDGRYEIPGVGPGTYDVRASIIGYETQTRTGVTVPVSGRVEVNFVLEQVSVGLNEVVVVGYASQRQRDLSGAITTVDADRLNPLGTASINQMMQGKAPGLNLRTRSAQPGGGVTANIRGAISPRGNNTPLYVIDGVPMTEYRSSVPGIEDYDLGFYGGIDRDPLAYLNPNDIASITVLKDASATAIYGSAAANGVVLITTKSGRAGDLEVSYTGSYTAQRIHDYFPILGAQAFMQQQSRLAYERYLYENKIAPYGTKDPTKVPPYIPLFTEADIAAAGAGTDWLDLVTRNGYIQEHNISLRGGSVNTRAYFSFNYQGNQAVLQGSTLDRYTGRLNLDQTVSDAVRLSLKLSAARLDGNNASSGGNSGGQNKFNMLQAAYAYAPTVPVFDENGAYSYSYYRTMMSPAAFLVIEDNSSTTNIFATPNLEVDLSEHLKANVVGQFEQESTLRNFYLPRTTNNDLLPDGMAQKNESTVNNYSAESYLTYVRTFGTSDLTVVGGVGYYEAQTEGMTAQGVGYFTDAFSYNNIGVASDKLRNIIGSYRSSRTKVSQFARANYAMKNRYILSLVARRDGSSIFSEKHRYGFFPGVSAAWILSEEPFLRDVAAVSQLKLRVGYGLAGNESVLSGNTLQLYNTGYPFLIGTTEYDGVAISQVANPFLTWEKTNTFNVGLDFGLWRHRVSGSFDYFVKTARDLLDFNPLPANNAVGRVADNVGSTRSRGFEVALHTLNADGSSFNWATDVVVSRYRSYWLERNPQVPLASYIGEHDALDAIYGWESDGIITSAEDRPEYMPNANVGNLRYVDQNGDGLLDAQDVVILGNFTPRWEVGMGNTLRYRGFDLHVFVYGSLDFKRNNTYAPNGFGISQIATPENTTVYARDIWSSTNPDGTYPGIADNPYNSSNPQGNDFNLKGAGFLRIKDVTLGYSFPTSLTDRVGSLRQARIFVQVQNLGVITNYPGFDPEYTEANPYPKSYSTTLGLELDF